MVSPASERHSRKGERIEISIRIRWMYAPLQRLGKNTDRVGLWVWKRPEQNPKWRSQVSSKLRNGLSSVRPKRKEWPRREKLLHPKLRPFSAEGNMDLPNDAFNFPSFSAELLLDCETKPFAWIIWMAFANPPSENENTKIRNGTPRHCSTQALDWITAAKASA